MRRFWILIRTELKAWRREPITAPGGFILPVFILIAFASVSLGVGLALTAHRLRRPG